MYFACEYAGPPPGGSAGHGYARFDEAEYVVTGEREFRVEDRAIRAPPGTFMFVPRGAIHGTAYLSAARWVHIFTPAEIGDGFFERQRLREAGIDEGEIGRIWARYGPIRGTPRGAIHVVVPPKRPTAHRVLIGAAQTRARYGVVEHRGVHEAASAEHDADEGLYVAAGELSLDVGGATHQLGARSFALIPRGTPHALARTGDAPLRYISILSGP